MRTPQSIGDPGIGTFLSHHKTCPILAIEPVRESFLPTVESGGPPPVQIERRRFERHRTVPSFGASRQRPRPRHRILMARRRASRQSRGVRTRMTLRERRRTFCSGTSSPAPSMTWVSFASSRRARSAGSMCSLTRRYLSAFSRANRSEISAFSSVRLDNVGSNKSVSRLSTSARC